MQHRPRCNSSRVRRSHVRLHERFRKLFTSKRPYRCACEGFAAWSAVRAKGRLPPPFPWLATPGPEPYAVSPKPFSPPRAPCPPLPGPAPVPPARARCSQSLPHCRSRTSTRANRTPGTGTAPSPSVDAASAPGGFASATDAPVSTGTWDSSPRRSPWSLRYATIRPRCRRLAGSLESSSRCGSMTMVRRTSTRITASTGPKSPSRPAL